MNSAADIDEDHWQSILAEAPDIDPQPGIGTVPAVSTWSPINIDELINGQLELPKATIGERVDGVGLLYPGRQHSVAGETESMKTWFAHHIISTELAHGHTAVFIDFEDDPHGIISRLRAIHIPDHQLLHQFAYIRPEMPLKQEGNTQALQQALSDLEPVLVVIDGVTEAMTLNGLNPLDNKDAATFGRLLMRPITDTGAATLVLDHVTKDRETRGRYAIGAVHKLNGLNGISYTLDNQEPLSVGHTGTSHLIINKDRPGDVRQHAKRHTNGHLLGTFTVTSHTRDFAETSLELPTTTATGFRPTILMERVSRYLETTTTPQTKNSITTTVSGNKAAITTAITCLINENYINATEGPNRSILHTSNTPFRETK